MKQPEALRLADGNDECANAWLESSDAHKFRKETAAELRRLHQSEQEGWRYAKELEQERKRLHEANQAMLEALKELKSAVNSAITCGDWVVDGACDPDACLRRVEAAITKGEQQ